MTTHLSAWQARQEIYLLADKKGWFVVRPVIPLIDLSKAINIQFTITRFVKKPSVQYLYISALMQ